MHEELISKRTLYILITLTIVTISTLYIVYIVGNDTTVVFCDVGQGDASYIRVQNKIDILIDAGPDKKVLECLGKYMPLFDRTIELAFITHPDKDHMKGFQYILERYRVDTIFLNPLKTSTIFSNEIWQTISDKHIKTVFPQSGTHIHVLKSSIVFLWPEPEYLATNIAYDTDVLGISTTDTNSFSFIFEYQEGDIEVLYTGDASPLALSKVINSPLSMYARNVSILKVPHHGSKNGLTASFFNLASPTYSVISDGKKNSYGHPAKETLGLLSSRKTHILRTDQMGDIVFKIEKGKLRLIN
jgi:competence protein ComEC